MSIFTKKSVSELRLEAEKGSLRRSLGRLNLTALGVGSIIGTGIFVLTGTAASQNAGPALVISMIIAGVACAFAGLCYAELAAMIPVAGSAYTYAYATTGELFAWIVGWDLILEYALSMSTIAVGWSGYFVSLMRDLGWIVPPEFTASPGVAVAVAGGATVSGVFNIPAAVIVLLVTALLIVGIRESANTNTVLVVIKSVVLVIFVAAGISYVNRSAVLFSAYIGFDAVSTAAQESKNPQKDLPFGILVSLALCTVLYIAVAIVLIGIVPYTKLNVADPIAVGIEATGLTWFSPVVKVSALFGLFSTMLVQLLGQTRIFYSMSRDGLLPPLFGRVHPKFRTPHLSTLVTGIIVAVAAGLLPLSTLSQLVSMGTLLAFTLVCIGIIILRKTAPDLERPFRTPGMPWVPALGALACVVQMVGLPWETWARLIIWLVLGMVVYVAYGRHHAVGARAHHSPQHAAAD